jgi:hypothetical protein
LPAACSGSGFSGNNCVYQLQTTGLVTRESTV